MRTSHGAVIGARALVLKDVPPYAVVGGFAGGRPLSAGGAVRRQDPA